jgi:hypothetical protein
MKVKKTFTQLKYIVMNTLRKKGKMGKRKMVDRKKEGREEEEEKERKRH